jgi:PD-(D/E)XK nuclease superfamily
MRYLVMDNSLMKVMAECSTQHVISRLKYMEKQPSGALQVGTMCHHVVQRHLQGMEPVTNEQLLLDEYDALVGAFGGWLFSEDHLSKEHPKGKPQYRRDNIRAYMVQWLLRHPQPQPFPTIHIPRDWVEINFEIPLDTMRYKGEDYTVVVSGQLDALGEEGDEIVTVETKTVGRLAGWWESKFEGDSQNTTYQFAAEVTTGRQVLGTYINAIETAALPNSSRSCYSHTYADIPELGEDSRLGTGKHPEQYRQDYHHPQYRECGHLHANSKVFLVTRDPSITDQWRKDVMSFAKKFVDLEKFVKQGIVGATKTRTQGRFHEVCIFCNAREWCIRHARSPEFADMSLLRNTEVRDVRTGIFTEEEFAANAIKPK